MTSSCNEGSLTLLGVAGGGALGVPLGWGTTGAPSAIWEGAVDSFSANTDSESPDTPTEGRPVDCGQTHAVIIQRITSSRHVSGLTCDL